MTITRTPVSAESRKKLAAMWEAGVQHPLIREPPETFSDEHAQILFLIFDQAQAHNRIPATMAMADLLQTQLTATPSSAVSLRKALEKKPKP